MNDIKYYKSSLDQRDYVKPGHSVGSRVLVIPMKAAQWRFTEPTQLDLLDMNTAGSSVSLGS